MNDVSKVNLKLEIAKQLTEGVGVEDITKALDCSHDLVITVSNSPDFLQKCQDQLENDLKIKGLRALHNIDKLANNKKASHNVRFNANKFIVEKALEISEKLGTAGAVETMTQDELIRQIKAFEKERAKRARTIEGEIIEHNSLDDMMT